MVLWGIYYICVHKVYAMDIEWRYEGVIGVGSIERVMNWHLIVGEKL